MDTLDDLLSKRRRGALTAADQRRLDSALRSSREYELALLAQDVFERDGGPLEGDTDRLRALVDSVERRRAPAPPPARRWRLPTRALVPVLIAGAAAAAAGIELSRPRQPAAQGSVGAAPANVASQVSSVAPQPSSPVPPLPSEPPVSREGWAPALSGGVDVPPGSATKDFAIEDSRMGDSLQQPKKRARKRPRSSSVDASARTRGAAAHAASAQTAVASGEGASSEVPPASASPGSFGERQASRPRAAAAEESAASLFRRANQLRQSDWPAAARLYARLIRSYPASNEAGVSEVALAKWSFAQGRSGDAVEWFRAYQRRGTGALTAEAMFGEARALESIGSHGEAQAPWRRLLEAYPDSPYADVARERLGLP